MKSKVIFDSQDVDRLVRYSTLGGLDEEIEKAEWNISVEEAPHIRLYWEDYKNFLCTARIISEFCFFNDIPVARGKSKEKGGAMPAIIQAMARLEQRVKFLEKEREKKVYL